MPASNRALSWIPFAAGLILGATVVCHAADTLDVSFITDAAPAAPASHGEEKSFSHCTTSKSPWRRPAHSMRKRQNASDHRRHRQ